MFHVDYRRWMHLIEDVLRFYSQANKPQLFELGAGTGVLGSLCREAGFSYLGSDLSYFMCKKARSRVPSFFCADGRNLAIKQQALFDLVLFLYDGINYLLSKEEYGRLYEQVHPRLRDGGLFLFDVTTVYNSKTNFNEYIDADDLDDVFYFRHSFFNEKAGIQHNNFTIFSNEQNGLYKKSIEYHQQRVFEIKELKAMIPADLFDIVAIWDNFSRKRYTVKSERVHFLLRKKGKS
jgi:hypothetical protein